MDFANNLKKLRLEQNLSQEKLATLAGVSQTAIYHWEKGIRNPKYETIVKLANALETPVSEFIQIPVEENNERLQKLQNYYYVLNDAGLDIAFQYLDYISKIPELRK